MMQTTARTLNPGVAGAEPRAGSPERLISCGAAVAAPVIPALESALGFRPRIALSSAQVSSEWSNFDFAVTDFPFNLDYPPLTFCLSPGVHFKPYSHPLILLPSISYSK